MPEVGRTTKPIIYFDAVSRQWIVQGKDGAAIITFGPNIVRSRQAVLIDGTATLPNANIGSTGVIQALRVAGTATITALNVGTLGTIRDLLAVAGTLTNVNVGTLATLRTVVVAGQGSLAATDISGLLKVGISGTDIGKLARYLATLPLTNVGTLSTVTVTLSHVGTLGANAIIAQSWRNNNFENGLVLGQTHTLTDNIALVRLTNILANSVVSQPAIGLNLLIIDPTA